MAQKLLCSLLICKHLGPCVEQSETAAMHLLANAQAEAFCSGLIRMLAISC